MIKQLLSGITAVAITMTSIPAHAESTYDWQETINKAKAYEERTGKQGFWTRGKHTNAVFQQVQGADGYIFGNVLNDDVVLPRVQDIRKVIEAAKDEGKVVIVASNEWILPSNPVFCEVARQVNMDCGDFTVMLMTGSSELSDEEFIAAMDEQTERLEEIARSSPGDFLGQTGRLSDQDIQMAQQLLAAIKGPKGVFKSDDEIEQILRRRLTDIATEQRNRLNRINELDLQIRQAGDIPPVIITDFSGTTEQNQQTSTKTRIPLDPKQEALKEAGVN